MLLITSFRKSIIVWQFATTAPYPIFWQMLLTKISGKRFYFFFFRIGWPAILDELNSQSLIKPFSNKTVYGIRTEQS